MSILDIGAWFLLISFVISALASVVLVGKKREPLSGGTAVIAVIINALSIAVVWALLSAVHNSQITP